MIYIDVFVVGEGIACNWLRLVMMMVLSAAKQVRALKSKKSFFILFNAGYAIIVISRNRGKQFTNFTFTKVTLPKS
jgi:hypothetical protein